MRIDKVLVGIDFSAESDAALQHAIQVCRKSGATLLLAHAFRTANLSYVSSMSPEHVSLRLVREVQADSRAQLDELCARHADQGVRMSGVLLDRQPDYSLAAKARAIGADLVVVGTQGRTGLARLMLGSVAERTVRFSETAVLVARHASLGEGGYRRILVPTDFSPNSEAALQAALGLVGDDGRIDVLHCWRLPSALPSAWSPAMHDSSIDPLRVELTESVQQLGNKLSSLHQAPGTRLDFHQREEWPVEGILGQLEGRAYDLVVMGSHGRRGLRRWLLGSVAEATVRHAHCSVLVTHAGSAGPATAASPPDEVEAE